MVHADIRGDAPGLRIDGGGLAVDSEGDGLAVVDAAADAARDAIGVAQILGDSIVDAAETVGDGLVSAGEGVAKWSVTAAGDTVDWSKTSFAEVAEWTERAAGDVASFTIEAYKDACDALEVGAKWVWEQIAGYFYETLPKLGGLDPKAREVAAYLLSDPVARGIESLCAAAGCVITFGVKLKAVSSLNIGVYACGEGWGFFVDSGFDSLQEMIASPSLAVGVAASNRSAPFSARYTWAQASSPPPSNVITRCGSSQFFRKP